VAATAAARAVPRRRERGVDMVGPFIGRSTGDCGNPARMVGDGGAHRRAQ
jgi:hypothetical protein